MLRRCGREQLAPLQMGHSIHLAANCTASENEWTVDMMRAAQSNAKKEKLSAQAQMMLAVR